MNEIKSMTQGNLERLRGNTYPGRGFIQGVDQRDEHFIQIYWVMGRSESSRNRVLVNDDGRISTAVADPAKAGGSAFTIYNAMQERNGVYVVSNGDQTDTVIDISATSLCDLDEVLADRAIVFEGDAPNYTPRITGWVDLQADGNPMMDTRSVFQFSMLRKSPHDDTCQRMQWRYPTVPPGSGYCIHTYSGDGDPLPPFEGEPLLLPLRGGLVEIVSNYWEGLNHTNRVAIAGKFICRATGKSTPYIINRETQMA